MYQTALGVITLREIYQICKSTNRDASKLCIVSMPMDVLSLEQTGNYKGHYFV